MSRCWGSRGQLQVSGAWVPGERGERGKGSQRAQTQTWLSSGFSREQPVLGVRGYCVERVICTL